MRPLIGITADATADKFQVGRSYIEAVERTGGAPVVLPCRPLCISDYLARCDGILLSGGDDPIMTRWGVPMHPKAKPLDPARQDFEIALLDALQLEPDKPALGVCLGMQLMGLHAGGTLDQHLPDSLPTADLHWDRREHEVIGELGHGIVHSHHRQALTDPGSLSVIARASDGVIEAVRDNRRAFYLGVQWHPERTTARDLGVGVIAQLVSAARTAATGRLANT